MFGSIEAWRHKESEKESEGKRVVLGLGCNTIVDEEDVRETIVADRNMCEAVLHWRRVGHEGKIVW